MHDDPYATGVCAYWHLSTPPPELTAALSDGWIRPPGRALDIGCGLGLEAAMLGEAGFRAVGVDLSSVALARASAAHPAVLFVQADVRSLPFADGSFEALLDRGCFHYLAPADRSVYASEALRVLRPGGRFLLRACLRAAGVRNDIGMDTLLSVFAGWDVAAAREADVPSDTRNMKALVVRLQRPRSISTAQ
ncbi:MAG: class I SAM-dependent methyltransferase [Candidatus Dormibacteria bacterium]